MSSQLQTPEKDAKLQSNAQSSPFLVSNNTQASSQKFYETSYLPSNAKSTNSNNLGIIMLSPKQGRASESSKKDQKFITPRAEPKEESKINAAQTSAVKRNGINSDLSAKTKDSQIDRREARQPANDLFNINVQNKKQKQSTKATLEIWEDVPNENHALPVGERLETSDKDSDIADEFEYRFDPYYRENLKRCFSPQAMKKSLALSSRVSENNLSHSVPRNHQSRRRDQKQIEFDFLDEDSEDGMIHKACHHIKTIKVPYRKRKHFVRRMQVDIERRDTRDKTFDYLKENFEMRESRKSIQSMRNSPRRDTSKSLKRGEDDNHHHSAMRQSSNFAESQYQSERKKLRPEEIDQIYSRLMQYDQKKQKDVQKMKEQISKQQEEMQLSHYVHNKKLNKKQQQQCYDRLAKDAERRKVEQKNKQQQLLLQREEEMKTLFKPKINQKHVVKREQIDGTNNNNSVETKQRQESPINLDTKAELFKNEEYKNESKINISNQKINDSKVNISHQSNKAQQY